MHGPRAFLVAVVSLLLLACSDSTAPSDPELVGHWATERANPSPSGWHQYRLTFDAGGRFTQVYLSVGVHGGRGDEKTSTYSRGVGTYHIEGDRLFLRPSQGFWPDALYTIRLAARMSRPSETAWPDDDLRYEVAGDRLTLRYFSYPADAPVPTTQVYFRQR